MPGHTLRGFLHFNPIIINATSSPTAILVAYSAIYESHVVLLTSIQLSRCRLLSPDSPFRTSNPPSYFIPSSIHLVTKFIALSSSQRFMWITTVLLNSLRTSREWGQSPRTPRVRIGSIGGRAHIKHTPSPLRRCLTKLLAPSIDSPITDARTGYAHLPHRLRVPQQKCVRRTG